MTEKKAQSCEIRGLWDNNIWKQNSELTQCTEEKQDKWGPFSLGIKYGSTVYHTLNNPHSFFNLSYGEKKKKGVS